MKIGRLQIKYQETSLALVLKYFVEGYLLRDDKHIIQHEAFIDQTKGVVVFKLIIENKNAKGR